MAMETTVLGYPRIGGCRELKKATESWWAGRIGPRGAGADGGPAAPGHLADAAGRGPVGHPVGYVLVI